jgi:uncharacterized membrane protein
LIAEAVDKVIRKADFLHGQILTIDPNEITLFRSPQGNFSLRLFIWEPGKTYPVHDHGSWGVVGAWAGIVEEIKYRRLDDGNRVGYADLAVKNKAALSPGELTAVLPLNEGTHQMGAKEQKKPNEVTAAELISRTLVKTIRKTNPDWSSSGYICNSDLNHARANYVKDVLEKEKGELSALEEQIINSLKEQELLSKNINIEFDQQLTYGERLADRLADFAGSWSFITIFFGVLLLWIAINTIVLIWRPFDPYPFILLNLILSCLAAMQAPVIMMSQNRQETKDRLRAEHDYQVNLKAELEIRNLHDKLDHILTNQWQRLLEIQEMQMELMEQIVNKETLGKDA